MPFVSPRMSLKVWSAGADPYDHEQLADNFLKLDQHDHSPGRGTPIGGAGILDGAITSSHIYPGSLGAAVLADGSITTPKLADGSTTSAKIDPAILQQLGVSSGSTLRRGYLSIPTLQTRNAATYATLTTPDQVTVTLPSPGLIAVAFQATWQESVASSARAAIFLTPLAGSATQIAVGSNDPTQPYQAGGLIGQASGAGVDRPLSSFGGGLLSGAPGTAWVDVATGQIIGTGLNGSVGSYGAMIENAALSAATSFVPTGAMAGGPCYIRVGAGTYDVSIRFRATSSATVTVKNRNLWVWTVGF